MSSTTTLSEPDIVKFEKLETRVNQLYREARDYERNDVNINSLTLALSIACYCISEIKDETFEVELPPLLHHRTKMQDEIFLLRSKVATINIYCEEAMSRLARILYCNDIDIRIKYSSGGLRTTAVVNTTFHMPSKGSRVYKNIFGTDEERKEKPYYWRYLDEEHYMSQ